MIGHWTWGGGWLSAIGFSDFAGSTIVHSVGGWVALAGIVILGPRSGRFGFNGGSQLSLSSVEDAIAVTNIFVNTNAAAAAGVITMAIVSWGLIGRIDLPLMLNGALAGLVSITAEPGAPGMAGALGIGADGALVMMAATALLERARLGDAVGAIPVHLAAGIWGTLAVVFSNPDATLGAQAIGIAATGLFTCGAAFALSSVINVLMGARLDATAEHAGADLAEFELKGHNPGA